MEYAVDLKLEKNWPPELLAAELDKLRTAHSHAPMMFSSMLTFHIVATLCMGIRFYSKRLSLARHFLDDYVLIASWVRTALHAEFTSYALSQLLRRLK